MPLGKAASPLDLRTVRLEAPPERPSFSLVQALAPALLFLALGIALAGIRPLWLDEVLQLIDTRGLSPVELVNVLPQHHPGSAPLSYLAQQSSLRLTGYSVRLARLPAVLFGAGAVFFTVLLARATGVRRPWTAGLLLALLPLFLRYGTEARPYSQAVCFSVLATWLFVAGRSRWLYALALVAAVYSQPYAASVGLAHVGWALSSRRRLPLAVFGLTTAVLAFLPWYLFARQAWTHGLPPYDAASTLSWRLPLILLRELVGASYWASGLIVILVVVVIRGSRWTWAAWMLTVPLIGAVLADAIFGYFLAARQYVWIVPILAIVAAKAIETRWRLAVPALAAICLWHDVTWFRVWHEDWAAAAQAIALQVHDGAAWQAVPPDQRKLYTFFQPGLRRAPTTGPRIVLVISAYTDQETRHEALRDLDNRGYRCLRALEIGGSSLVFLAL